MSEHRAAPSASESRAALLVGDDGRLTLGVSTVSGAQAFADLWNFRSAPVQIQFLTIGEATRLGFVKTGNALRGALTKARERFGA